MGAQAQRRHHRQPRPQDLPGPRAAAPAPAGSVSFAAFFCLCGGGVVTKRRLCRNAIAFIFFFFLFVGPDGERSRVRRSSLALGVVVTPHTHAGRADPASVRVPAGLDLCVLAGRHGRRVQVGPRQPGSSPPPPRPPFRCERIRGRSERR